MFLYGPNLSCRPGSSQEVTIYGSGQSSSFDTENMDSDSESSDGDMETEIGSNSSNNQQSGRFVLIVCFSNEYVLY